MVCVSAEDDAEDGLVGSAFPDCPRCGDPVLATVVTGPTEASASPCGCRVPPPHLERE